MHKVVPTIFFMLVVMYLVSCSANSDSSSAGMCGTEGTLLDIYELCGLNSDSDKKQQVSLDEAFKYLNERIRQCPTTENLYYLRGTCFRKSGNLFAAITDYKKALVIQPNAPFVHQSIGSIYLDQSDYEQAIIEISKEIDAGRENYNDYVLRAKAYTKSGLVKEALADYEKALSILQSIGSCPPNDLTCYSPIQADIYSAMVNIMWQSSNRADLIRLIEKGLESNPGSTRLQEELSHIQANERKKRVKTEKLKLTPLRGQPGRLD